MSGRTWQASILRGRERIEEADEIDFWVLVRLHQAGEPTYYVIPEWWIENNIYEVHAAMLAAHGGQRVNNPDSKHHKITLTRVEQWRYRWDLLGIFD